MNFNLVKILVIAILVVCSCKSQQVKNRKLDFKSYCLDAFNKGLIDKDPLILLDAKPIGLLSEIDFEDFEYKIANSNSLKIIPKGLDYLKRFWGENAKNGIIEISKFIALHCGDPPENIFLLNNKEVNWQQLKTLKTNNIKYWIRIDDIVDFDNKDYVIDIIITKK